MGGGAKAGNQQAATNTGSNALTTENQNASALQNQLLGTSQTAGGQNATIAPTQLNNLVNNPNAPTPTSGFDPSQVTALNGGFQAASGTAQQAAGTGTNLSNTSSIGASSLTPFINPTANATYSNLATTGGFTPQQQQAQIQQSSSAAQAGYNANQDQLNRQKSVQGGYMPGFTSSMAALQRGQSQAGANANLNANVALNQQINANKATGAGGLTTETNDAANAALGAQRNVIQGQTAGGDILNASAGQQTAATTGQANLATNVASGVRSSQQLQQTINSANITDIQSYINANNGVISSADQALISNRMSQLGYTQAAINAFLGAAGQQTGAFQNAASVVGDVTSGGNAGTGGYAAVTNAGAGG